MDSPACFQAIYKHVGQQKIVRQHPLKSMTIIDWCVYN